jgi:hypothetical protein
MNSFVRKLAITGGAAVVLLGVGGTTAATTARAAGATAVTCTFTNGTATITPPDLGNVPPVAESFMFAATVTCHGSIGGVTVVNSTGQLTGNGYCASGSLVTCVPGQDPNCAAHDNIDYTVMVPRTEGLSGCGVFTQQGVNVAVKGAANGSDAVAAHAVFTVPVMPPPYGSATFSGSAHAAGPN